MRLTRCWTLAMALVFLRVSDVLAQSSAQGSLEALIRRLDHAEAQGLLRRDSTALRRIWARDFTVNNPRNSITRGAEAVVALIRNGTIDYSSFVRDIETVADLFIRSIEQILLAVAAVKVWNILLNAFPRRRQF